MEEIVPEAAEQAVKKEVERGIRYPHEQMQYPEYEPHIPTTPRPLPIIPTPKEKRPWGIRIPLPGGAVGLGPEGGRGSQIDLERLWNEWEALGRTRGTEFSLPWDRDKTINVGGREQVGSTLAGLGQALKGIPSHPDATPKVGQMPIGTPMGMGGQVGGGFMPDPDRISTGPSFAERFQAGKEQWKEQDPVTVAMAELEATFKEQYPNPTRVQEAQHASELARIANELPFEEGFWPGMGHLVGGEFTNPIAILTGKALYGPATKLGLKGLGYGLKGLAKVGWEGYKFLPNLLSRAAINVWETVLSPIQVGTSKKFMREEGVKPVIRKTIEEAEKQAKQVERFEDVDPQVLKQRGEVGEVPISEPKLGSTVGIWQNLRDWAGENWVKAEQKVPWLKHADNLLPGESLSNFRKVADEVNEGNVKGTGTSYINVLRSDVYEGSAALNQRADDLGIDLDVFIRDWVEGVENIQPRKTISELKGLNQKRVAQMAARTAEVGEIEEQLGPRQYLERVRIAGVTKNLQKAEEPFYGVMKHLEEKYGTTKMKGVRRGILFGDKRRTSWTIVEAYEEMMFGSEGILDHIIKIQNKNYTLNKNNTELLKYWTPDGFGNLIKGPLDFRVLLDAIENIWARDPLSWNSRIPGSYEIDKIETLLGSMVRDPLRRKKSNSLRGLFNVIVNAEGIWGTNIRLKPVRESAKRVIDTLDKYFPQQMGFARTMDQWGSNTFMDLVADVASGAKHMVAMAEWSVSMIQNMSMIPRFGDIWLDAAKVMARSSFPGGEASIREMSAKIRKDPYFNILNEHLHLPLDEPGKAALVHGEEVAPMGETFISRWMRRYFPLAEVSERSTRAFIASVRYYSAKRMIQNHKIATGKMPSQEAIAVYSRLTESLSGRGPLPGFDVPIPGTKWQPLSGKSSTMGKAVGETGQYSGLGNALYSILNAAVFSVRKQTGPFDVVLTAMRGRQLKDIKNVQEAAMVRQQINYTTQKLMAAFFLIGQTVGLIHLGNKLGTIPKDQLYAEIDPRSPNFWGIRDGLTWFRPTGEYTKWFVKLTQLMVGEQKSGLTGLITEKERWGGEGKSIIPTEDSLVAKQARQLVSPIGSTIISYDKGEGLFGEKYELMNDLRDDQFSDPDSFFWKNLAQLILREGRDIFNAYGTAGVDPDVAEELGLDPAELQPESVWAAANRIRRIGTGLGAAMFGLPQTYENVSTFVERYGLDYNKMTPKQKAIASRLFEEEQFKKTGETQVEPEIIGERIDKQSAVNNLINESFDYRVGNTETSRTLKEWLAQYEGKKFPYQIQRKVQNRFSEIMEVSSQQRLQEMAGEGYLSESAQDLKRSQLPEAKQLQMMIQDRVQEANIDQKNKVLLDNLGRIIRNKQYEDEVKADLLEIVFRDTYNFTIPQELLPVLSDRTRESYEIAEFLRNKYYDRGYQPISTSPKDVAEIMEVVAPLFNR